MPNFGDMRIVISTPVHTRLAQVKERLQMEKERQVTFSETLEILLDRAGEREDQGA